MRQTNQHQIQTGEELFYFHPREFEICHQLKEVSMISDYPNNMLSLLEIV